MPAELVYLCCFAFLAGFIDAIAGGGGLIQIPALFLFLPDVAATQASVILGTNKLASICGTSVAMVQYGRYVKIDWQTIVPAGIAAFAFAFLGAHTVSVVPPEFLRPLVFVLLVAVGLYTLVNKQFGDIHQPQFHGVKLVGLAVVVGAGIGFYDGFFGPGTGSFLVFAFIGLFGFSFLNASASAKAINVATNLAAILYFAASGSILYEVALPMGLCNMAGGLIGSRMAILRGNRFVRVFFLLVSAGMLARLGWEIFVRQ